MPNLFLPRGRILVKATKLANQIDKLKFKYRQMTNEQLSNQTNLFIDQLKNGKSLDDILPEAFATAREAIYRVHGLFAYKVQLIGAIVAHNGDFAEMYTGEGKTVTIIIVAYLNALLKKGVHIITVNEYLVKRDAQFCAEALNPLGITVGYNLAQMDQNLKRSMFACDITYTSNSELGFDYLRDNMVLRYEDKVIRDLNFAIIDEADSVLIDEARTPLIISGQPKVDVSLYVEVALFTEKLSEEDYKIDLETNSIFLTDKGVEKAKKHFKLNNLYNLENSDLVHKIRNALMAQFVLKYGIEYIVKDNKILLIDHFTGRILEGRSYNAGLHQAIQAKERVKIDPENIIVATITYQSFFRLYKKIAGFSGTALTEEKEFINVYNMVVVPIPTNKKVIRKDLSDYVFETRKGKWEHIAAEIKRINETGQPILVGTASVEESEELSNLLRNKGLKFELLNAKNHAKEAEIVALAGQKGAITISTNMAGRGTDIKLGQGVKELGGLFVIGTDKAEARRVDNQLRGRSGRQGDPGSTRFFISLEDSLFKRFMGDKQNKATEKVKDDAYFDSWFFNRIVKSMQKKIEGLNYDMRKNLIDYDVVLSNQRELIYKQRDQIIKNEKNLPICYKMIKKVAYDYCQDNLNTNNLVYVNVDQMIKQVNKDIFGEDILSPEDFKNMTSTETINKLCDILIASVDAKVDNYNQDQINNTLKSVMLQNLDNEWTQHLDIISKIREGIYLRSLEQKSPLNIYVEEADTRFGIMKRNIAHKVVMSIHKLYIANYLDYFIQYLKDRKLMSDARIQELENKFKSNANQADINLDFSNFGVSMGQVSDQFKEEKGKQWEAKEKLQEAQEKARLENEQESK